MTSFESILLNSLSKDERDFRKAMKFREAQGIKTRIADSTGYNEHGEFTPEVCIKNYLSWESYFFGTKCHCVTENTEDIDHTHIKCRRDAKYLVEGDFFNRKSVATNLCGMHFFELSKQYNLVIVKYYKDVCEYPNCIKEPKYIVQQNFFDKEDDEEGTRLCQKHFEEINIEVDGENKKLVSPILQVL